MWAKSKGALGRASEDRAVLSHPALAKHRDAAGALHADAQPGEAGKIGERRWFATISPDHVQQHLVAFQVVLRAVGRVAHTHASRVIAIEFGSFELGQIRRE